MKIKQTDKGPSIPLRLKVYHTKERQPAWNLGQYSPRDVDSLRLVSILQFV